MNTDPQAMSAPEQRWVLVPHSLTEDMGRAIELNEGPTEEQLDGTCVTLWQDAWSDALSVAPKPSDEDLERAARVYDEAIGISWRRVDGDPPEVHAAFRAYRRKALRAALDALGA